MYKSSCASAYKLLPSRLNSELLDSLRGKQLIMFYKVLDIVRQNQVKEQRDVFSQDEKEALCRFVQPDYSFSLMFRLLLKKHISKNVNVSVIVLIILVKIILIWCCFKQLTFKVSQLIVVLIT